MARSKHYELIRRLTVRGAKPLRDFRSDTAGAVAIMVVLLVPVMVGMMGLTVDVGIWYSHKRGMQDAADAAAMAAGIEIANGGDTTAARKAGEADADRNGFVDATDTITVNVPPLSGPSAGDAGSAEVIITRTLPLFFTTLFLNKPFLAQVRAVVNTDFTDEFCILGLDPTEAKAVSVQGTGSATLDCGIAVNSDADNALNVGGSGFIGATSVTTVGGVAVSSNGTLDVDSAPRRGAAVADPYDDLTIPTFSGCDNPDGGTKGYTAADGETLNAGGGVFVLCGGLNVSSGVDLNLEPGTYIIDEGDFKVNGGGSIVGADVTIIITSSGPSSKIGNVAINGGADIELSAPTTDLTGAPGYSGVLFYQDRLVSSNPSKSNFINGGAEVDLQGALYFPNQDLSFSGGAEAGDGCTQLIAKKVAIGGNAGVQGNCNSAGTRSVGRLVAKLGE